MKTTLWKPCDLENTEKTEQILSKDPVEINWFQNGGNFLDPEIPKKKTGPENNKQGNIKYGFP